MAWLASRRVAVALAAVGFIAFFARALLDWRFVYGDYIAETDVATTTFAVAFYAAVGALWIWGLLGLAAGRRNPAIIVAVLSLLFLVLAGLATPVFFCPGSCKTVWPLFDVVNLLGLVVGALAAASAWLSRTAD
jgi:hypothetical protein